MPNKTSVRAPKFELYQLVILHWNREARHTKIVRRFFDPDDGVDGTWVYLVSDNDRPYPEGVFEARGD